MASRPKRRGGDIDDITLVPVSPSRQRRRRRFWALGLLGVGVALFVIGLWLGAGGALDATETNRLLRARVKAMSSELEQARNELALYRTETRVGAKAREKVRQQVKQLRDQVAELEEAVAFYKNVMAPGAENGLRVEKLSVEPEPDSSAYRYQVVLVQVGDNRRYLSGEVEIRLLGHQDGEPVTVSGKDVLDDGSETGFRFRFFQELNGRFKVPDGMEVNTVEVEAESSGGRRFQAQKTLQWQ